MRNEIIKKLDFFIQAVYLKFKEHPDNLTISAIACTQYINYLVEKGIVLQTERFDLFRSSLRIIERQFNLKIPDFAADGLMEIMKEVRTYDYETLSLFIK